jgi:putative methylase
VKRSELVRRLAALAPFDAPKADREQVATPPEAAALLLEAAVARDDLVGRTVVDLGSGPGTLAIGAALLGAGPVRGIDDDPRAVEVARRNASSSGVSVDFRVGDVTRVTEPVDTVVMNPPFGAQRRHADRPFWDAGLALARRRLYAFSAAPSRTFIEERAVARGARVEATEPVPWELPRTFPHHRKRSVELSVDLWVLTPAPPHERER